MVLKKIIYTLLLAIFIFGTTSNLPVFSHDGDISPDTSYICDGKKTTGFKLFILKFFKYKYFLRCTHDTILDTTPQPSSSPTPTLEPTPIATEKPTSTPTPNILSPNQFWHEPKAHDGLNTHEHGDKPPVWADEFSKKNFEHPVMFGGDEATTNENALKHQAYKGFLMNASGVDIFIRYHSMSAPTDRMGPLHSYEVYAKDSSNNISFWQGWIFHGYPEHRSQRMPRHGEQAGFDPFHNITWPGRGQFIIAGSDIHDWADYKRCEQWYGHAGLWSWDLSITICGATTYYSVDEHKGDVYNQSTWQLTGDKGGGRRLEVSHYGPQNPLVGGENLPFNQWFCVRKQPNENRSDGQTPTWNVGTAVSGPDSCPTGWLPQFVADTFPKKGVYFETGNTAEKDFPTQGVTVPN